MNATFIPVLLLLSTFISLVFPINVNNFFLVFVVFIISFILSSANTMSNIPTGTVTPTNPTPPQDQKQDDQDDQDDLIAIPKRPLKKMNPAILANSDDADWLEVPGDKPPPHE